VIAYETAVSGVTLDKVAVHLFSEIALEGFDSGSLGYHYSADLSTLTGIAGMQT
jgi:hypothetical protein